MTYVKSPLNYTGNKLRILDQILPHFPNQGVMVDLFSGGATVGINTDFEHVIFIDSDPRVINLLEVISQVDTNQIVKEIEKLIGFYKLSYSAKHTYSFYTRNLIDNRNNGLKKYNSEGYYELRKDYNSLKNKNTIKANIMLYTLMIYAFNNDIRFNSKGEFNLPVGKTDLNSANIKKLYGFKERANTKQIDFVCGDFRDEKIRKVILNADFIYMDPPYLITEAVYNKTSHWTENTEFALLSLMDELIRQKKSFVLSNVITKFGKRNEPLFSWLQENGNFVTVLNIDYHYRSASYNKKNRNSEEQEIIVRFCKEVIE